jgi:tetratricopeptide (TPR) repeat protein
LGQIEKAIDYLEQALKVDIEIGDRKGKAIDLGNLGQCYSKLGKIEETVKYYERALKINREIAYRHGEAMHLGALGVCYSRLGQIEKSIDYLEQSLKIDKEIGDKTGEGIKLNSLGDCYSDCNQTEKAVEFHNQSIQVADEIGFVQVQNYARCNLARVFLFAQDLTQARTTAEAALKYDYPTNNHNISALFGVIALRQNDIQIARQAFQDAVSQAEQILNQTPQFYEALDAKALALAGLTVCEYPQNKSQDYVESAKAAFRQARVICSAKGVVSRTLKLFDALAAADEKGILGGVREILDWKK